DAFTHSIWKPNIKSATASIAQRASRSSLRISARVMRYLYKTARWAENRQCNWSCRAASQEAPPGFEPGIADLQSAALPLGEGADDCGLYRRRRCVSIAVAVGTDSISHVIESMTPLTHLLAQRSFPALAIRLSCAYPASSLDGRDESANPDSHDDYRI